MVNTKEIKKRMIDYDLTNAQLADEVGVSVPYMSSVINGKRTLTLHVAEKIQKVLEIPNELFGYYFLRGKEEQKGTEDDNQPTEPASTAR